MMGVVVDWVYDHSPKPVRDWLESRGIAGPDYAAMQSKDMDRMYDMAEFDKMEIDGVERPDQRIRAEYKTTVLDHWNFEPKPDLRGELTRASRYDNPGWSTISPMAAAEQLKRMDEFEAKMSHPGTNNRESISVMANRDQERKQERDLATNQWERRISQGMAARAEDKKVEVTGPTKKTDEEKERSGPER